MYIITLILNQQQLRNDSLELLSNIIDGTADDITTSAWDDIVLSIPLTVGTWLIAIYFHTDGSTLGTQRIVFGQEGNVLLSSGGTVLYTMTHNSNVNFIAGTSGKITYSRIKYKAIKLSN